MQVHYFSSQIKIPHREKLHREKFNSKDQKQMIIFSIKNMVQ